MRLLTTPDDCFASVPDFAFAPHFTDVGGVRMAHVEAGPKSGATVLCLHGEPSWSFLYRKVLPVLAAAGLRAIAPDLVGFGRSDKPAERSDYTYQRHLDWLKAFIEKHQLDQVTLLCQDWGGLLGLRLVSEMPDRFARVVATNTFLPTGLETLPDVFFQWRAFSQETENFDCGAIVAMGCTGELSPEVVAAYNAPFPSEEYKAGPRQFPMLVPSSKNDVQSVPNQQAWKRLEEFAKPFLTAFSDRDPITAGGDKILQQRIPGARGQSHITIEGAGHFVQEDKGEVLGRVVADFVAATPV
jgi:haloalkane dehalogenase